MHKYHPIVRLIFRIILLPIVAILHAIPHILGWAYSLCNWVRYGGEFLTLEKTDIATIGNIYRELITAREQNEKILKILDDTE